MPTLTPLPDHGVWSHEWVVETALKIFTEDVSMVIRVSGPSFSRESSSSFCFMAMLALPNQLGNVPLTKFLGKCKD